MKIGIFTDAYTPAISGVVTSIKMLASGLRSFGHEVYIFTTDHKDNQDQFDDIEKKYTVRFKGMNVPIKALKGYKLSFKIKRKAKYILNHFKLDVIHAQTEFSMGKLAIRVAKLGKIPLVYTFHTLYEEYLQYISKAMDKHFHNTFLSIVRKVIISPLNKIANIKIVPTKKVYLHLKNYALDGDIRVVPTGLELEMFQKEYSKNQLDVLKKELNIPLDHFIYLSLGRVSKEKSIDIVIRAFANTQKDHKSILLIVGDGPALTSLKDLVKKLDIDKQVIFTGFIDWYDTPIYYKLANFFVNASTSETQGLTYIEALASGIPVLVQSDECLDGVVINEFNGILFDGEIDLANKMTSSFDNLEKIENMRQNCAKSVEKFSKSCYATNVEKIYLDAISE